MKIEGILQKDDYFYITLSPTWWEKFIGHEQQVRVYKEVGKSIYIDKEGNILPHYSNIIGVIDKFKRKRLFNEK